MTQVTLDAMGAVREYPALSVGERGPRRVVGHPVGSAPVNEDPLAAVAALPGVAEHVARGRDALDDLLRHRVMRRHAGQVAGETAVRSARASAALEGVDWSLEQVRGADEARPRAGTPVVRGALRVLTEMRALSVVVEKAPLQALARLHLLAASGLVPESELGRPRTEDQASDDGPGRRRVPGAAAVAVRLEALADLLVRPTRAPAIVVAAIVHGEVLTVQPFTSANGLVARAAARLVLHSRGVDARGVCSPEVGHVELGAAYTEALDGYAQGSPTGVSGWVRHCAEAVRLGARDGMALCEAIQRAG